MAHEQPAVHRCYYCLRVAVKFQGKTDIKVCDFEWCPGKGKRFLDEVTNEPSD